MEKFKLCAFADEADKMISGQIAALQGNSMNLIELRGIDGKNVADITPAEAKELKKKLDEFSSSSDNLEEVFENREQIEISRYYERLPKPALIATQEFLEDKVYYRNPLKENTSME
jgi:hypothetical protein